MPEGFLFDTVTCSRWRRGDRMLRQRVVALPVDAILYTSVVSVGELAFGIRKAPDAYRERLQQRTQEMLTRFHSMLDVTYAVAETMGRSLPRSLPVIILGRTTTGLQQSR